MTAVAAPATRVRLASLPSLPLLGLALLGAAVVSLGIGAVPISPAQTLAILFDQIGIHLPIAFDATQVAVLLAVRLPRVLASLLVGGALATAGVALQAIFRNPLADPWLVGVSGGASCGAAAAVLGAALLPPTIAGTLGVAIVPLTAFVGALAAALTVLRLARMGRAPSAVAMLLCGIAVNALASAGTGLLTYLADDTQLRRIAFWQLGSLGGVTWRSLPVAALLMVSAVLLLLRHARQLDVLVLGEAEAGHLGIEPLRVRRRVVALAALCTGAAVALTGMIAFVGLVVPHIARMLFGAGHRGLISRAALLGAVVLTLSDLVARTALAPSELPIGIVTSAFGAPFFLWLLIRKGEGVVA